MRLTVVAALAAVWFAALPASASASGRPRLPTAAISIVPGWTYRGVGRLAVSTRCSSGADLRVVTSKMLRRPVSLPRRGDLLIRVRSGTRPGRYTIAVWCVTRRGFVDAMDAKWVTIRSRLRGWRKRPAPRLPRHFRPRVTVYTWSHARP